MARYDSVDFEMRGWVSKSPLMAEVTMVSCFVWDCTAFVSLVTHIDMMSHILICSGFVYFFFFFFF